MNTLTHEFDTQNAEAFAERFAGIINDGAIAVMSSIGHRLGLFDALAQHGPVTSETFAQTAGLAERYAREWLSAMVTGGIVAYDPATAAFALPPERAACLTRNAPLGNLAVFAQHIALMGQMQDAALRFFRSGEGTRYGDYPCFHQIMAEDSDQTVPAALFGHIIPQAEGLAERLASGIDVFDAGCGRGGALMAMAEKYPNSRFTGMDLCADAIAHAARRACERGLRNISFAQRDLTGYDEAERFDLITSFDAVHDQKDPQALVRAIHRALRPGGIYIMQDIGGSARLENNLDYPMASLLYAVSSLHCTPVSIGQGGLGLGTMWGWETAQAMLAEAGFASVDIHRLPQDPLNVWFIARR